MTETNQHILVDSVLNAARAVVDSGLWHPTDASAQPPLWVLPLPDGDNVDPVGEWTRYAPGGGTDTDSREGETSWGLTRCLRYGTIDTAWSM